MTSTTYVVDFERVGRNHNVAPMTFEDVTEPEELAALIHHRVKGYLASRWFEVIVDLDEMRGHIDAGMRPAGRFTITMRGADA